MNQEYLLGKLSEIVGWGTDQSREQFARLLPASPESLWILDRTLVREVQNLATSLTPA